MRQWVGWYERQKAGLGMELKEAVDQMLVCILSGLGHFGATDPKMRGYVAPSSARRKLTAD